MAGLLYRAGDGKEPRKKAAGLRVPFTGKLSETLVISMWIT